MPLRSSSLRTAFTHLVIPSTHFSAFVIKSPVPLYTYPMLSMIASNTSAYMRAASAWSSTASLSFAAFMGPANVTILLSRLMYPFFPAALFSIAFVAAR